MSERDSHTGRFVKHHDPFTEGRTINEATYDLSNYTLEALNYALAQAQSDIDNVLGGTK
jgi:hypothetical protein